MRLGLANKLETEYAEFFGNNKIDRTQLYSEIMFHIMFWNFGVAKGRANPTELNIYSDGKVRDPREWLNKTARFLFGGQYEE